MTQGLLRSIEDINTAQTVDLTKLRDRLLREKIARQYEEPRAWVISPDCIPAGGVVVLLRPEDKWAPITSMPPPPTADLPSGTFVRYIDAYTQLARISCQWSWLALQGSASGLGMSFSVTWHGQGEAGGARAAPFLAKLYILSEKGLVDDAITDIINQFDCWLEASNWLACEEALGADVERLHPAITLSMLSMTLVEKRMLESARQDFYAKVRRKLIAEYGEPEAAEALRGLA
jgi:hypothetical protein